MNALPAGMLLSSLLWAAAAPAAEPPSVEQMLKRPTFVDMKISPTGRYLAATVPQGDDKTILIVLERETMKSSALLQMRGREHVRDFAWVSDDRLVVTPSIKQGMLDSPIATGELYGVNADGKGANMLFGYRQQSGMPAGGSNIRRPEAERASAVLLDTLPEDAAHVLITVQPWDSEQALYEVRKMNVNTGHTSRITRAPVARAEFLTDRAGNVRLATGTLTDHVQQIYGRPARGGDWALLHDESKAGYKMFPFAFDADGKHALVQRQHPRGADSVYRWNIEDNTQTAVLEAGVSDPVSKLTGIEHASVYAVRSHPDKPELHHFDPDAKESRLAQALAGAFPGQHAYVTSYTRDGAFGLVHVYSDRNPGEFYLFELSTMRATYLGATREWIDPDRMGEMRPFAFTARDGTPLRGYLLLPPGREPRNLPLVVNPHGGPHGIRDYWSFDEEAQLLATRGYAVLRVNFRGSGGYGAAFESAGYRQWGGTMQDDIADAVRWAVSEGHADAGRVCIYGASYGGYSALMNAARYPDLYRCTVGYVGVYDLDLMYRQGDVRESMYGRAYLARILGTEKLAENSPVNHAARITMPVMLIHGGEDIRVPQTHADRMRRALKDAGNDPEWLVERREGHGFYNMDNRVKLYTQLLAFLDRHIGEKAPARTAASPP